VTEPAGLPDLDVVAELIGPDLLPGPLSGHLVVGGKSNLTYRVTDGTSTWAVRRPPLGHVLPTAHDMSREFRILTALHGTAVPVPQPIAISPDGSFYVMEWIDGAVLRDATQSAEFSTAQARQLTEAMMHVLAELHVLVPEDVGLGDFGRPAGFLERQVRRWNTQLESSRSRELPGVDELITRLGAHVPKSPSAAIVHGDYRLDNLIIGPDHQIAAVVDWEMATIGDPLTDLGLLLVYWDGLSDLPSSVSQAVGPDSPFPRGDELIAAYARESQVDLSALAWYVAFGYFKLAVIAEGIYFRHAQGQTVGTGFDDIGDYTAHLIARGNRAMKED
jgi:aminoglycoside phosphotransferase (APT) family kinase protein